jgi:hypothetical protein
MLAVIEKFIDNLPVATITAVGGGVLALIGYLNGDLTIFQALAAWGITSAGGGAVGHARNGAGRGLRR